MEMKSVIRVAYWACFFLFALIMLILQRADKLGLSFKIILVVLLAFLSAKFRLEDRYSFLSIVVVLVAGIFIGAVLAGNAAQFWALAFVYVILFFLSCEVFERGLLGVEEKK
ncbi:hypothetical protein KY363_02720 [Candidatus Woesearchaeota archaeon]|nr:hypothetical protein [Candidatus Woesearchaeota archaeon]